MRFHEKLGFRLTQHAYYQYCRRVDHINWHELINRIRRHIEAGDFYLSGKEFANVGGVWWVYRRRGDCVYFVTCYGRSHSSSAEPGSVRCGCPGLIGVMEMSSRPLRPCAVPLCPNLTRERYCEQHAYRKQQDESERQRFYDQHQRDKKAAEFYRSREWQRLRERRLALDHYLCRNCLAEQKLTRATEVDHIIPIRVRWDLRLELSNTRSLCHRCHMRKTAEDRRRYKLP